MIDFFDGFVQIGHYPLAPKVPVVCEEAADVSAMLVRFGIGNALVWHFDPESGGARFRNRLLAEALHDHAELLPCWEIALYPVQDQDRPERLIEEILAHGIRAVHLSHVFGRPDNWRFLPDLPVLGELQKHEIPLFCALPYAGLDELCRKFPDLSVVNTTNYNSSMIPLMRRHPRLSLATASIFAHNALETLCRHVGAERLIFASAYGRQGQISPGGAITALTAAGISPAEKQMIASGNLRKILKLSPAGVPSKRAWDDPFVAPLRSGRPVLAEVIVDAHAHTFTNEMEKWEDPDAAGMIKVMDRLGVNMACIAPNGSMCAGETEVANAINRRAATDYPGRFIAYTRVAPSRAATMEPLLRHNFEQAGICHVKLHPSGNQYPLNGVLYEPAFRFALEHKAVVLSHSEPGEFCNPRMFDEIACRYPQLKIIIGHAGNQPPSHKDTVEVMRKHSNLYTDTSGWCATCPGVLEYMVAQLGSDRILFGTDFSAVSAPLQMGAIVYADIPLADKRKIMGLNACGLFQIGCLLGLNTQPQTIAYE